MSTSLHALLKADSCLKGVVADGKADPSASHQLSRYLSFSIFKGQLDPWTPNMCLDRLDFLDKVLATVVKLFWQTGQGCKWQIIHDIGVFASLYDVVV